MWGKGLASYPLGLRSSFAAVDDMRWDAPVP